MPKSDEKTEEERLELFERGFKELQARMTLHKHDAAGNAVIVQQA